MRIEFNSTITAIAEQFKSKKLDPPNGVVSLSTAHPAHRPTLRVNARVAEALQSGVPEADGLLSRSVELACDLIGAGVLATTCRPYVTKLGHTGAEICTC